MTMHAIPLGEPEMLCKQSGLSIRNVKRKPQKAVNFQNAAVCPNNGSFYCSSNKKENVLTINFINIFIEL